MALLRLALQLPLRALQLLDLRLHKVVRRPVHRGRLLRRVHVLPHRQDVRIPIGGLERTRLGRRDGRLVADRQLARVRGVRRGLRLRGQELGVMLPERAQGGVELVRVGCEGGPHGAFEAVLGILDGVRGRVEELGRVGRGDLGLGRVDQLGRGHNRLRGGLLDRLKRVGRGGSGGSG